MNSSNLRSQVLSTFKKLHQTRKNVFKGDIAALDAARKHINDEFSKHKSQKDLKTISNLVEHAQEVEEVMRQNVIQAVKTKDGNYRVNVRKDIQLLDTANPYKAMPEEMIGPFKGKKGVCEDNK